MHNLQVVTVAKFEGGGAFNVIPDSVTIGGTFRAFSKESFIKLKHRIEEVNFLNATFDVLYLWQPGCPFIFCFPPLDWAVGTTTWVAVPLAVHKF